MKLFTRTALCFALLTGPAMANSQTVSSQPTPVRNVALHAGGTMNGVALNTAAKPIANADVAIMYGQHVIARTKTRKDGTFAVRGLRGGMHTVRVGTRSSMYRLWSAKTAPPNAVKVAAINGDSNAVRGQYVPPIGLETVAVAVGAGLIGGIIGYQVKDDNKRRAPASP
ncbi:MAG: hypothetical protein AB8G99_03280 [Planctomycetaceae bacterium]